MHKYLESMKTPLYKRENSTPENLTNRMSSYINGIIYKIDDI